MGSLGFGFRELAIWVITHPGAVLLMHCEVWVHDCLFCLFWTEVGGDIVNDVEHEILCKMFGSVLDSGIWCHKPHGETFRSVDPQVEGRTALLTRVSDDSAQDDNEQRGLSPSPRAGQVLLKALHSSFSWFAHEQWICFRREERHLHRGQLQLHLPCNQEQLQGFVEPAHGSFSREVHGSPRVMKFRESGAAPCRGYGSACLENDASCVRCSS